MGSTNFPVKEVVPGIFDDESKAALEFGEWKDADPDLVFHLTTEVGATDPHVAYAPFKCLSETKAYSHHKRVWRNWRSPTSPIEDKHLETYSDFTGNLQGLANALTDEKCFENIRGADSDEVLAARRFVRRVFFEAVVSL